MLIPVEALERKSAGDVCLRRRSKQRTLCCQGIDGYGSIVQEDAEVVENSAGGQLAISVDPHCNAWKVWRCIRKDGCLKLSAQKGEEQAGHSILDDLCVMMWRC